MKLLLATCLLLTTLTAAAQKATLKSVLLEQLKTTHNKEDWFVPVNIAIDGLTAEQASWKDATTNHSIAQLVNHLIFWNLQSLAKFFGLFFVVFFGVFFETFSSVDKTAWEASIKRIDSVMVAWEKAVETADETKLQQWYDTIAHISTHNAYHTGQIIYIRKMRGNWNADKGVK